jgi:hypothetical protein
MSGNIGDIAQAVEGMHHCKATLVQSVPVQSPP